MIGPQRAAVEQEFNRLTEGDNEKRKRDFAAGFWKTIDGFEKDFAADELAARWRLLDAYVARMSVVEDPSSIFHAERMAFAREVCEKLIARSGLAYAGEEMHRWRNVGVLLGGKRMQDCILAAIEKHRPTSAAA